MRFSRDNRVSPVLVRQPGQSSCIFHTLRFCARYILALIAMDGMYAGFAGAKACREKITIFRGTLVPLRIVITLSRLECQNLPE
jgi:hypothetical protein